MIAFPNCKINLGLNIINKREDGYHDLETVFFPLPFTDILEIIFAKDKIEFTVSGLEVNTADNLCLKAYDLLKKKYNLPAVKMHLHKVIPLGAGLGGGSADAAFALFLLNEKFKLNLTKIQLIDCALQLGSDCPFFVENKPCFATSRGEMLEPINVDLTAYKIVLINPRIHIETKWAFSKIVPHQNKILIKEIIAKPVITWKDELKNDFEIPVFEKFPVTKQIKEYLYENGAAYASLSGSGSTVFGLFEKHKSINNLNNNYFYKVIYLNT